MSLRSRVRQACLLGCVSGAALMIIAGPASAATYPGAGSAFSGGAEGWTTGKTSCQLLSTLELPLLCTASGGYDGSVGNPAGSLAARTEIPVNLVGVFKSEVTAESPDFIVGEGGAGTVRIERQYEPGGLASLNPSLAYTVTLVDKTGGMRQQAIAETVAAKSVFLPKEGAVTLAGGHTYAVQVVADIDSTILGVGLLGGEAVGHFDNLVVTGPGSNGGGGGGGGNGGNGGGGGGGNGATGLTDSQLSSLIQGHGVHGVAAVSGNKISVKAKCPAKVGKTCKVTLLGLIKKGKAATTSRTAKISQGRSKKLTLTVKRAALPKVMARKRLLFKLTVKAGTAKATVYKSLKLIKK
jgi:hypothetical protein